MTSRKYYIVILQWKTRISGFKYMYDLKSEDLNFAGDGFWSFSDGQQRKQHIQNGEQKTTQPVQDRQDTKG